MIRQKQNKRRADKNKTRMDYKIQQSKSRRGISDIPRRLFCLRYQSLKRSFIMRMETSVSISPPALVTKQFET